jgi:hypothetical protein
MAGARITKRLVDALEPSGREIVVWDSDLAGFGVRVRPSSHKTFIVQYRAGSGRAAPDRKLTLGSVGTLTPDEARAQAKRTLGAVANGADPGRERKKARDALTVSELITRFMAEHVIAKRKQRTAELYGHIIKQCILPVLGTRAAADERRRMSVSFSSAVTAS